MSSVDTKKLAHDCLSASWLAERLAVDPGKIEAMRRGGELIAVREEGSTEWLYPTWQLDGGSRGRRRAHRRRRARGEAERGAALRGAHGAARPSR